MKNTDSRFDEYPVTDCTFGLSNRRKFLMGVLGLLSATAGCAQQESQNSTDGESNTTTSESSTASDPSETVSRPVSDDAAWPAPGYDPQNRNRNPTVSVSTPPELVRSVSVSGELSGYQIATVEKQLFFSVNQRGSNDEVIRVGAEQQTLSVAGSQDAFADVVAGPDGLLHVGNLGVTTIDTTNGEVVWRQSDGGNTRMTPTLKTLYTTGNQSVFAFDARTGELQWSVRDLTQFECPPAVDSERVYVAGAFGKIYAFDRFTGERQWTRQFTNAGTFFAPTLTDELLIVLQMEGTVFAYDKSNGDLRWRANLSGDLFGGSASLYDSTVIVSTRSGTNSTRAFDVQSGEEVWRSDDTVRWYGLLCEQVYVGVGQRGAKESSIVGISAKEGDPRWELTVSGDVMALFAAYDALGAITYGGQVHILSTSTSPLG